MQRYLLVVLGMHRSGTSALCGALAKAGANPGVQLMPPTADNPGGYWECLPVVQLNDRLLQQLGTRWDTVGSLPHAWQGAPAVEALRVDAVRIVASEFGDSRVSVLKDPRMCRLLPFWRDVLEDAGFTLGAALMVRQPMEVVASLARRDKFAPEKSLVLWLSHVTEAEAGSRGLPRGLVTYDGLLENPDAALTRICDDAGFPLKPTAAHRKAAADLVQPMLKRQQYDATKVDRAAMASGLDKALESGYAMLAELSPGADLRRPIESLVVTSRAAVVATVPPWLAEELATAQAIGQQRATDVDAARHHIEELVGEVEAARAAHTERDAAEAALRDHIARNERDLADERTTIADLAQQLDVARTAAEDNLQQIAEARANIDALVAELEVARAGADMQNQEIEAARSHIEALGEEIVVARAGALDQQRQIEAAQSRIEALVSRFEDASRSAAERARREAALRTDVVRLAEEAGVLRSERDALAPVLRETQEAAATIAADRDRLAQLERGARERGALLDGRIAALESDVRALRARDEANAAELARLSRTWYGRLARRLVRPR